MLGACQQRQRQAGRLHNWLHIVCSNVFTEESVGVPCAPSAKWYVSTIFHLDIFSVDMSYLDNNCAFIYISSLWPDCNVASGWRGCSVSPAPAPAVCISIFICVLTLAGLRLFLLSSTIVCLCIHTHNQDGSSQAGPGGGPAAAAREATTAGNKPSRSLKFQNH